MPRYDLIFVVDAPDDDAAAEYQRELVTHAGVIENRPAGYHDVRAVLRETEIKQSEEQDRPLV